MGKKKEIVRVVLDTNVLVSSLLFRGAVSELVTLWETGKIVPVVSGETFDEFRKVLMYPKFSLTEEEIQAIIHENILPFFEVCDITENISGICRDSGDDKFIACAVAASADFIVSGDKDLCALGKYRSVKIITMNALLKMFR